MVGRLKHYSCSPAFLRPMSYDSRNSCSKNIKILRVIVDINRTSTVNLLEILRNLQDLLDPHSQI